MIRGRDRRNETYPHDIVLVAADRARKIREFSGTVIAVSLNVESTYVPRNVINASSTSASYWDSFLESTNFAQARLHKGVPASGVYTAPRFLGNYTAAECRSRWEIREWAYEYMAILKERSRQKCPVLNKKSHTSTAEREYVRVERKRQVF